MSRRRSAPAGVQLSAVEVPADAPDVLVSTVDVIRSILHPLDVPDETSWSLSGAWIPAVDATLKQRLRVHGDLSVASDRWFAGVTSYVDLTFRGDAVPAEGASADDLLDVYGPWVAHILWDVSTMVIRVAAAQSLGVTFELPVLTPPPKLVRDEPADADTH